MVWPIDLVAGLHAGVAVGHDADAQQRAHLLVVGEQAVGVGDEDPLAAVAVAGRHLHDRRRRRPRAASSMRCSSSTLRPWARRRGTARRGSTGAAPTRVSDDGARAAAALAGGRRGGLGRGPQARLRRGRRCGRNRWSRRRRPGCRRRGRDRSMTCSTWPSSSAGRRGALVLGVHLGELAAGAHCRRQAPVPARRCRSRGRSLPTDTCAIARRTRGLAVQAS